MKITLTSTPSTENKFLFPVCLCISAANKFLLHVISSKYGKFTSFSTLYFFNSRLSNICNIVAFCRRFYPRFLFIVALLVILYDCSVSYCALYVLRYFDCCSAYFYVILFYYFSSDNTCYLTHLFRCLCFNLFAAVPLSAQRFSASTCIFCCFVYYMRRNESNSWNYGT